MKHLWSAKNKTKLLLQNKYYRNLRNPNKIKDKYDCLSLERRCFKTNMSLAPKIKPWLAKTSIMFTILTSEITSS